jgi:hypothetical protein
MTSAAALVRRHATNLRRVAASAVGRDSTYGTGRSHPATHSEVLFDPAALGHLLPVSLRRRPPGVDFEVLR